MVRQAVFPDLVRFFDCLNYGILQVMGTVQGVTKRCRPSWLTNSAQMRGGGRGAGSQLMSTAVHMEPK
jgi:hypothetical protein